MRKRPRNRTSQLSLLAAPVWLGIATVTPAQAASVPMGSLLAAQKGTNRIDGLSVTELDDGSTVLRLQGDRKPTFNVYRLENPDRLVVDIAASERGTVVPHIPLDTWACGRVTIDPVEERDAKLVRVVVELKRESSYIVVPREDELVVTVTPRDIAPEAYFARKSAHQRREEIEASAREVDRAKRDAKALRAEAQALSRQAKERAQHAERRASAAETRAQTAESAESRARAAEQRAKAVEQEAKKSLDEATSNRFRLRRELKQAEADRARAQAERQAAVAARAKADRALAQAQARLDDERQALAAARARVEAAEQEALAAKHRAKQTLKAAETEAQAKLAAADKSAAAKTAAADATLARAHESAAAKTAAADATLAQANESAAAKTAAADATLAQANERAAAKTAAAAAKLKAAEKHAAEKNAAAEATLAEAEKHAAERKAAAEAALALAKKSAARNDAAAAARLADAATLAEQQRTAADRKLAQAREAAAKIKAQADTRLADAESTHAEAKRKLAAAKAAVEAAEADAAARLAKAQAKVDAANVALRDAEAGAKRRLEKAAADADRDLRKAKVAAKATELEASTRLASARRSESQAATALSKAKAKEREADRLLADARKQAKVEAAKVIAAAEAEASKKKSGAEALQVEAKQALATASIAVAQAQAERKKALDARAAADAALAEAKRKLSRAETKGSKRHTKLERELEAAEHERSVALSRQREAESALAKLKDDRDRLSKTLAEQQTLSKNLEKKIASRKSKLQQLTAAVTKARAELDAAGGPATKKDVEAARAEAARTKKSAKALGRQIAHLRKDAESARARAAAAEREVASLEESGARRRKLERARADARVARTEASRAKKQLDARKGALKDVERELAGKQAAIAALKQRHTALANESQTLAQDNVEAKKRLKDAQTQLAKVRGSLDAEKNALADVEDDVRKARARLEARVADEQRKARVDAPTPTPTRIAEAARTAAPEPKPKTKAEPSHADEGSRIKDVRFVDGKDESLVIVELDGPIRFEGSSLTPTIKLLELHDAAIAKKLERSLDATAYDGPIKLITSFSEGDSAKVIVSTREATQARLEERPGELVWHFPRSSMGKSDVVSMAGSKVGGYASPARPLATTSSSSARVAAEAETERAAPPATQDRSDAQPTSRPGRARWRGERIDIELQDAPIKDVLLLFSDIGRTNIIAGRNVEGNVTMKLTAVPWDQALDIILRSLNLGMQRDGNVIRVATMEDLEAERRAAIERANAQVQLKPLETRLRPVSYATVDEMVPKVQSVLSPRGTVTPDSRTNTLIIMDVAENIALAEQLIANLDTQTPQVLIEARIVEARTNFTRQLGIQWGFDYIASPGTGNPTGILFPNSVGVGGGATGTPVDSRGLILPAAAASPNYAVDLPAPVGTGSGGAIGFSFGSISGNLNTNLRLSAAEGTGEVRIISAPKVVTLDNSEAQIEQGVQIPISQVSAQGVNTRFVNASLSLRVTPHVTNEGAVLLDVQVQKNEADFINRGARGDPTILTKQARSRMLVNDNDTAVIGGIYTRNKAVNFTKIPWLADIPIIGWFFKNKSEADTRSEVLIFLTPKIVNRASSIGG